MLCIRVHTARTNGVDALACSIEQSIAITAACTQIGELTIRSVCGRIADAQVPSTFAVPLPVQVYWSEYWQLAPLTEYWSGYWQYFHRHDHSADARAVELCVAATGASPPVWTIAAFQITAVAITRAMLRSRVVRHVLSSTAIIGSIHLLRYQSAW